jgi:hypothetical protein
VRRVGSAVPTDGGDTDGSSEREWLWMRRGLRLYASEEMQRNLYLRLLTRAGVIPDAGAAIR